MRRLVPKRTRPAGRDAAPSRTLWIVEPELSAPGGHHFPYTLALSRAALRRGLGAAVICADTVDPDLAAQLRGLGVRVHPRHLLPPSPALPRVVNQARAALTYAGALGELRRRARPGDVALTFTGTLEWGAVAALDFALRGPSCPLVMQFFWWDRHDPSSSRLLGTVHELIVRAETLALRHQRSGALHVTAQAAAMAGTIGELLGREVVPLPFPLDWSKLGDPEVVERSPVVGYLGAARNEKGFPEFVDAVEQVSPTPAILAQTFRMPGDPDPGHGARVERLARLGARIIDRPLVGEEFRQAFFDTDVLVLPYIAGQYADRPSNLLAEAIGLGKVIVAPEGTWLGRTVAHEGAGVVYDQSDPTALARAIERATAEFPRLAAASRARAVTWRPENTPDAFLDTVLRIVDGA